ALYSSLGQGNPSMCGSVLCSDAFVSKLNLAGTGSSALVFSTYLGGGAEDGGNAIAGDPHGAIYVTGFTRSPNFPTVRPLYSSLGQGTITSCNTPYGTPNCADAFVARIDPGIPALTFSTYLGGSDEDIGYGITVDSTCPSTCNAYVTGFAK